MLYKDKCHAGSKNGNFCGLEKGHEGSHVKRAGRTEPGEIWKGNYNQAGVELIKVLNKHTMVNIQLTPKNSIFFGNIFDEATEKMDYSFCGDCAGSEYRD